MEAAVRGVGTRLEPLRQIGGMTAHLPEQVANQWARVLRMKRIVPFERAQQLLADPMVVRMAERAQACPVYRLGLPVQSASKG
jgi:hypothetical protein